jgi:hypothetical protein
VLQNLYSFSGGPFPLLAARDGSARCWQHCRSSHLRKFSARFEYEADLLGIDISHVPRDMIPSHGRSRHAPCLEDEPGGIRQKVLARFAMGLLHRRMSVGGGYPLTEIIRLPGNPTFLLTPDYRNTNGFLGLWRDSSLYGLT